jgi:transposase
VGLSPPIQMCDALSRNLPKSLKVIVAHCLSHGRRNFVEVIANFPAECRFVLETLGEVYGYDDQARERGLSPEERLHFHQEHSAPVMEKLHAWLNAQFADKNVEPNSGLGVRPRNNVQVSRANRESNPLDSLPDGASAAELG